MSSVSPRGKNRSSKPTVRCAIYTRKSSEEGLEQAFNSLDAQRESGEAYIKSQVSEGWICLPERYDDGGFTGGNMERPALRRLMLEVQAGKVDAVVVYKVDRLSRSLIDFAKMMEAFEKHKISFVSVTQRFSTADSMGRLTLNMLLSFAQFEREIISERTRDKIAAARRRGKWSGGRPILGYDLAPPPHSGLVVNEPEAKRVREIFNLYLKHEALIPVVTELDRRGWRTKAWTTKKGRTIGGGAFDKNLLYLLLQNVAYIGKVRHKENVYEGEQPGIVPSNVFERVQDVLKRNGSNGGTMVRNRYGALLKGILKCEPCNCSMGYTYSSSRRQHEGGNGAMKSVSGGAVGGQTKYCYYVCRNAQKRGWGTCVSKSVQASVIEEFVIEQLGKRLGPAFESRWESTETPERPALLRSVIDSVTYHAEAQRVRIGFKCQPLPPPTQTNGTPTRRSRRKPQHKQGAAR